MENKRGDILYCGVSKEKIKSAKPRLNKENLQHLYEWIVERYNIHLKKDVEHLQKPWTQNNVLQNYKFCNVRREIDRESKWLIKNIAENQNLTYENKLLNSILFRLINKSQTIKIFGILDFGHLDFSDISNKLERYNKRNKNYVYFSNAFFTSGPKVQANKLFQGEENIVLKIIKLVDYYNKKGIVSRIKDAKSQKGVYESLLEFKGLGKFLAYQIFVDFTYIKEFSFSENEFVVSGPGCEKGLKLIFKDFDGLNYEEALFWLRDNQNEIFKEFGYCPKKLFKDLPEFDRYLNIMSLENCMCEISKYIRALTNTGRPRIRYCGS